MALKRNRTEYGSSMAWTALVLSMILVPLLTLVTDGGRILFVRNRLQTATDAACEDAAWSAADFRAWRDSSTTTFETNYYWLARAQSTFYQSLSDQGTIQYSAYVSIFPDYVGAFMNCSSSAQLPLLSGAGLVASPVTVNATCSSRIRFRNMP